MKFLVSLRQARVGVTEASVPVKPGQTLLQSVKTYAYQANVTLALGLGSGSVLVSLPLHNTNTRFFKSGIYKVATKGCG